MLCGVNDTIGRLWAGLILFYMSCLILISWRKPIIGSDKCLGYRKLNMPSQMRIVIRTALRGGNISAHNRPTKTTQ